MILADAGYGAGTKFRDEVTALGFSRMAAAAGVKNPPFPKVIAPEAPPIRPKRHVRNSIPSVRKRIAVTLARGVSRCPCCATSNRGFAQVWNL